MTDYCASYSEIVNGEDICPDPYFYSADNDEVALQMAKDNAKVKGIELLSVCEFDTELGDDIRTVWCL